MCHPTSWLLTRPLPPIAAQVLSVLLKHIKHPLLPHQSVWTPVKKIIFVCVTSKLSGGFSGSNRPGDDGSSPGSARGLAQQQLQTFENRLHQSLVLLLHTLWQKMREDPSQLQFFFEAPPRGSMSSGFTIPGARISGASFSTDELLMFQAILPHISRSAVVGSKAQVLLMGVLPEP